ncbi:MAG: HIT family protein [Erysipelotrichaceae bacterium]|jgi:histidine triad (HIT) family protein|nr:HIT family protein [Erysipelotrichaceae bacterium]MBQ1810086.1 HIT family protein [Erysipelotrichaceae bacterium]MBQ5756766.1 HIT family protein [Erysipelotrichaceae bacterium]MBR3150958.1 HIT family protein [Erysipelotrichaceae bacterium]MBR3167645.1 HIT family protein [Erysipelotrichaceae bacterium]
MCVFCEIIKGNIPSAKVYEDDKTLAILDISQTTKGHTLVLPKQHYENLLEIPAEELAELIVKVQKIAANNVAKLGAKGFNLLVNTGAVAGQSVPHLHFHIIPRYDENDSIEISFKENSFDLQEICDLLK